MHERLIQWRRFGALLCVGALAVATAVAAPPQTGDRPERPTSQAPSEEQDDASAARTRAQFPRTVAWWPFTKGPHYGHADTEEVRSPEVIRTMVGSYRAKAGLDLPAELRGDRSRLQRGLSQYFVVQATESGRTEFEEQLTAAGGEIVLHLPVNAVVARLDDAAYGAVSALSSVRHIEPYHPGLRIHPTVGTAPQPTKAAAASPVFDLQIRLFLDEPTAPVVSALEGLGAQIVNVVGGRSPQVRARLHASKIIQAAKIEAVKSINDYKPRRLLSEGSLFLQSRSASVGDFPFWKVGLDGDEQIIHQTDSGMSVDAGDHAHTNSNSGWDENVPSNCNVQDGHRQVICYRTASELGGSGDLSACGSVDSGAFTHGQLTSGVAMGNATRGKVPAPENPSPTDDPSDPNRTWTDQYGDGLYIDENGDGIFTEAQDTGYDGIAKGARIVFHDADAGCPEGDPFQGGFLPGDEYQNVIDPWTDFSSNLHSFSWGSGGGDEIPNYSNGGTDFDQAVLDQPINLVMVSASNDGSKEDAGISTTPGNVNDQATLKNGLAIGSSSGVGGAMAFYSSEGPPGDAPWDPDGDGTEEPNLRVAPMLVAEGGAPGLPEYGCRSEDGAGTEDQTGEINCSRFGSQGTSFAAPNAIGAAAIVGEYLAEGFYPDGTNNNSNNDDERVDAVSSALTKAMLIAGSAPMGRARDSDQFRFNNVYGYGRIQLDNTLPLADFPDDTPTGMILHDVPGDIDGDNQDDGVSNLSLTTPLASGTSTSDTFEVVAADEDLKIALVWHDPTTAEGSLARDLDLTVTYCGTDNDCTADPDNEHIVWYGNAFSEDYNRDANNESDLDTDGTIDSYNYSMSQQFVENPANPNPGTYTNWRDRANNAEAVFVPWEANQPVGEDITGDGTNDFDIVRTGLYQVSVDYDSGTGDSRYSLAIIGPVAAGSSVRFERNPVACNGLEDVIVTEVEDSADPDCPDAQSCETGDISARTKVNVYDGDPGDGGQLVDEESGLNFTQVDGQLRYRLASPLPLSDVTAFQNNDGLLSVDDGYVLEVIYEDETNSSISERVSRATVDCSPEITVTQITQLGQDFEFVLEGGCDDDDFMDQNEVFSFQVAFANSDPVDLIDAVVSLTACENRENPTADNCTPSDAITVFDPVRNLGQLPAGSFQLTRFGMEVTGIPSGREMIDLDVCLAGSKTGQPVADCKTFTLLAQADEEKHYYITDCPDGCSGVRFDRNGDEVYEERVARNPFDTLDLVRRGLQEKNINYESLRDAADENNNGTPDCEEGDNSFTCGNPDFTGPWDFDSGIEGFRTGVYELSEDSQTGISNFGEDTNWNDTVDGDEDASKIGSTFTIDYNWGTNGGCGWASNSAGSGPGGMFHTGTIGNWDSSHDTTECRPDGIVNSVEVCEPYDVYSGTAGERFWFEYLRTPKIHPVHFGTDPRDGFDWRTQILDYSWAMQWDQPDRNAIWTWEFDLAVDTDSNTLLGDNTLHGIYGGTGGEGLVSGGNLALYDGGIVFTPTDDDEGSSNYGNEKNTTIGGDRSAKRGCWFNELDKVNTDVGFSAADRAVNIPTPADDECDNEYDLGPDGCPGTCGVDDDGNGAVDDPLEICPCMRCEEDGGPRAGIACTKDLACNPDPNDQTHHDCVLSVDSNGVPTNFGSDDVCGGTGDPDDGSPTPDEGVNSAFDLATNLERVTRQGSPNVGNGVAAGGRPNGNIRYNTLEDFFDPVGSTWQGEIGFLIFEPSGSSADEGYGMGVDEVVVEWLEARPIDQTEDKCGVDAAAPEEFEGQCARVMLAEENNTFAGDRRLELSVIDPVPTGNETTCNGARGVEVLAFSQAEPDGETLCLNETSDGGNHFAGIVETTTKIKAPDDGLVYTEFNGLVTPVVTVWYVDKNDGVHPTNNGPDGEPGIAGFDDDGDGTTDEADELCPSQSELAPGRSPHIAGQPSRYSDDNCGCLDNPVTAATVTQFDVADVVLEEVKITDDGDNDGFADPGEEVTVNVVFRNVADFPIEDLVLRASTDDLNDKVDCFTKDTIKADRIDKRDRGCLAPDPAQCSDRISGEFRFIAGPATRGSVAEEFRSEFEVTLNGLAQATRLSSNAGRRAPRDADRITEFDIPIAGFAVRQSFSVEHNLSLSGSEGSATTYENDFEDTGSASYTSDNDLFADWRPRTEGDDAGERDGNRCQYNDPFNPFGNNTGPQEYCEVGEDTDNTIHDWHLSSISGCGSQGLGSCQKGPGGNTIKSHGPGDQSLAMNWLNHPYLPGTDNPLSYHANRIQWIEKTESIQLRVSGDENGNPPKLEMWTMISLLDGRIFNIAPPGALDAAVTGVCVDRNGNDVCDTVTDGDGSERWEVIDPKINPYSGWRGSNFINCAYDPIDDGSTEDDFFANSRRFGPSSTCYPQLIESCLGRTSDPTVEIPQVYQHPTCFPETGEFDVEVPGLYEQGDEGTGVWAKQVYDLGKYSGQKILIRFLSTSTGVPGADIWGLWSLGFLNADDGWFIDDIVVTGVSSTEFGLVTDNAGGGGATCPDTTCDTATARATVVPYPRNDKNGEPKPAAACTDQTLEYCDLDEDGVVDANSATADSPGPRQAFIIEARDSETDTCFGGALEYKFETSEGQILSDWSTREDILVDPVETTNYDVSVRCSTDELDTCLRTETVTIDVPPYEPRDLVCRTNNLLLQSDKSTIVWDPDTNDACPAEYDVAKGESFGANFFDTQSCLEDNSTDTQASDPSDPNPGNGFWYVSKHTGADGSYSTGTSAEADGRDDNINACP